MAREIIQHHPRCEAVHPKSGQQCGQPQGHEGRHGNGLVVPSWEDEPALPNPPELYGE